MDFFRLLRTADAHTADADVTRRNALRQLGRFGIATTAALAAPPLARSAFAFGAARVHDVLNFALTLEYLEDEYYMQGLATDGLIPDDVRPVFEQIGMHESQHVAFLQETITSLGETPVDKPTFDFTGGSGSGTGPFNPFEDYAIFLALSQGFEDTGVRAYKGQAGNLYTADGSADAVLTAALQIHSVEARHAAKVRRLREQPAWIVFDQTNVSGLEPVYAGEDQIVQGGVDVTTITSVAEEEVTEAWDEPLTMEEVLAIAGLFIAG